MISCEGVVDIAAFEDDDVAVVDNGDVVTTAGNLPPHLRKCEAISLLFGSSLKAK